ncbi:MAG: hypothetical protein Q9192_006808, partial [Flavoplaca navasiana]
LNLEDELLSKWAREKAEGKIPADKVEELLKGKVILCCSWRITPFRFPIALPKLTSLNLANPQIHPLACLHNANRWRLQIHEGCIITSSTQTVAVLEAMKIEINVPAREDLVGGVVEKVLVSEGEVVKAGDNLMLIRMGQGEGKKHSSEMVAVRKGCLDIVMG